MTLTYQEAAVAVTAPGQIFETEDIEIAGVRYRAFKHVPASLRELWATARGFADKTFIVYEDERWSFAQVMAEVDALGAALVRDYGISPGDRVAIGMRNYPEWVVAFAAITSIGAISVSLNAWWSEDELDYALDDSGSRALIADASRASRTAASCARLGVRVLVARGGDTELPAGADRWEDRVRPGDALPDVTVSPYDDATILYTSGTTGRPKGAVSTHLAILQALLGFACRATIEAARNPPATGPSTLESAAAQSFILIVPLFHVTGCVPVMMSCFALGMKLVIMHRWDPTRALELIERERVTSFVGVPTQSWDLVESPRFKEFDTSSLRTVGGGGAPAPPALVRRVASSFSGGQPTIGYGMTETNAYGPGNLGADYLTHPTSTGRPTPILQIEIRDALGRALPTGELGEIWLKGPNLIRGYWGRAQETAETIVDGWLRTGDAGRLDADGFLYIEDRLKDMILRGGENVYSAEVEAALYEHPAVHEAAVFGVPHPRLGEEVAAMVTLKPGASATVEELQAHVGARLAAFKVPSQMKVVTETLPRNAAGKILKRELRTAFTV
ncbi:MAG: AMP-binding protein [Actinomycetota bacterium]|nr:AMP-binding protein [Actinomycetota bacterium]